MRKHFIPAIIILLAAGLLTSGWARKANKEELAKLEEQNKAAETAEKQLAELQAEKTKLEAQLEAKNQEVKKTEDDLNAVKAKVGQ